MANLPVKADVIFVGPNSKVQMIVTGIKVLREIWASLDEETKRKLRNWAWKRALGDEHFLKEFYAAESKAEQAKILVRQLATQAMRFQGDHPKVSDALRRMAEKVKGASDDNDLPLYRFQPVDERGKVIHMPEQVTSAQHLSPLTHAAKVSGILRDVSDQLGIDYPAIGSLVELMNVVQTSPVQEVDEFVRQLKTRRFDWRK
jgi:hypothetical protein